MMSEQAENKNHSEVKIAVFPLARFFQKLANNEADTNSCLSTLQKDVIELTAKWEVEKHHFDRIRKKLAIRQEVVNDVWEQIATQEFTWLAEPLPLHVKIKVRLRRYFQTRQQKR